MTGDISDRECLKIIAKNSNQAKKQKKNKKIFQNFESKSHLPGGLFLNHKTTTLTYSIGSNSEPVGFLKFHSFICSCKQTSGHPFSQRCSEK